MQRPRRQQPLTEASEKLDKKNEWWTNARWLTDVAGLIYLVAVGYQALLKLAQTPDKGSELWLSPRANLQWGLGLVGCQILANVMVSLPTSNVCLKCLNQANFLMFGWMSLDFFARPGIAMVYLGILQAFPDNCISLILVHIGLMVAGDWLGFVGFVPRRAFAQVKFERFPKKHGDGEVLKRQNIYQSARPLRQALAYFAVQARAPPSAVHPTAPFTHRCSSAR